MSVNGQPPSAAASNGVPDGPECLLSPSNSVQVAQNLIATVKALTSNSSYQAFAELVDEIPRLRAEVQKRDKELETLHKTLRDQETEHKKASKKHIQLFKQEYDGFNGAKMEMSVRIQSLENDVKAKENTIAQLNDNEKELKRQGRQIKDAWIAEKEKVARANARIQELEHDGKRKDGKIVELAEGLAKAQGDILHASKALSDCMEKNLALEQELEESNERLAELEGFAETLGEAELEVTAGPIEGLWQSAVQLVGSFFKEDLPRAVLENQEAWIDIKKPWDFNHHVPIPQSNSPPAKSMRIAVILAILARLIDKYIFQPTYILAEDSGIREILRRQAVSDSNKETFTRAILLTMFPDEQDNNSNIRVRKVVGDMMKHIQDLLPADQADRFRADLEDVVRGARDVWRLIQRLRERFEPSFELVQYEGFEWETIRFDSDPQDAGPHGNDSATAATEAAVDDALLMIFPRIYIMEDGEPDPITAGTVLMRFQSEEAEREVEEKGTGVVLGRLPSNRARPIRSRRLSVSMRGAPGVPGSTETRDFLVQAPSSNGH